MPRTKQKDICHSFINRLAGRIDMKYSIAAIILIIFGTITLGGSAAIYNYQMSQDGDIVYENGNWYELHANPLVISIMTLGMIIGTVCLYCMLYCRNTCVSEGSPN